MVVPVNPVLNAKQIAYIINHSEATAIFADDVFCSMIDSIKGEIFNVKHLFAFTVTGTEIDPSIVDFNKFLGDHSTAEIEDVIINDRDIFQIVYTSGTTSDPKGVLISHLASFIMSLTTPLDMEFPRPANFLCVLPMFHCAAQTVVFSTLNLGGRVSVMRAFDPEIIIKTIEEEKISIFLGLPLMYRALLNTPSIKEADFSALKKCIYGMAPMDRTTLEKGINIFDADFLLGSGQTECFPVTNTFKPQWQLKKEGNYWGESALTVDTAIMDDDGTILPPNEVGEIVWRGPNVMNEYLKNEQATLESRKFGWHHSGDLGFLDDDGQLGFVDRKKDMIKTGGENVPSIKVERVLLSDHRVAEAVVVGLPHEHWVEAVSAFIVKNNNADLTEDDVLELCKRELGGFEMPKKVVFLDQLPKTATGKMQKNVVRKQYQDLYN